MRLIASRRGLAAVALVLLTACGGSDAPTEPQRTAVALTPSASSVKPLQSLEITFPSKAGSAGATLTGRLGGKSVQLSLVDTATAAMLVPDISAGNYTLTVDFGTNLRGTVALGVSAAPTIADPRTTATNAVNVLLEQVATTVAVPLPADASAAEKAELAFLASKSAELKSALASASTEDLRVLSLFLAANPGISFAPATASSASVMNAMNRATGVDVDALVDEFMSDYTKQKITLVATIVGCAAGLPSTTFTGFGVVIIGIACGTSIALQARLLGELITRRLDRLYALASAMLVDESPESSVSLRTATSSPAMAFWHEPGVPKRYRFRAELRTINSGDRGIVGALFAVADEAQSAIDRVARYIPGWNPQVGPSPLSPQATLDVPARNVSFTAPGCTTSVSGNDILLTCPQVSRTPLNLTVTATYRNRYSAVTTTRPITVNSTWATVGDLAWSVVGTVEGKGCYLNSTMAVKGNTPVVFTGWRGTWSPSYSEGGSVNVSVDPRIYDGIRWHNRQFFDNGNGPRPFSVIYQVFYSIPALGTTGTISSNIFCNP